MMHVMPPFPDPAAPAPAYHPPEEILLDYAVGASTPVESLMIATHLAYCSVCKETIRSAQSVAGSLLDTLEPAQLPPNMLNRMLAAIDAGGGMPVEPPSPPLSAFLREQYDDPHWKSLPGGFRMRRIPSDDTSGHAWLFDAPPGIKLLPHEHIGDEWTMILSGLFIDNDHLYRVGDFGCRHDGEKHGPMVGDEGRCVSLIMVRHDPHYTTLVGKLAAPFLHL